MTNSKKLFRIPLLGANSPEVESFASYYHRISLAHGVSVGQMTSYLIARGQQDSHVALARQSSRYPGIKDLVRPTKATRILVQLIEAYTDIDLTSSVLWLLGGHLASSPGEVTDGFRWCPECIAEMHHLDGDVYFKLIWHMTAIRACPIHRSPLLAKCDFCGCDQSGYIKKYPIGFCQKCGNSLAFRSRRLKPCEIANSWEDIGWDVVLLMRDLSYCNSKFVKNGTRISIEHLYEYYDQITRNGGVGCELEDSQWKKVCDFRQNISLKSARRIAFRMGLTLYELLNGDASSTTDILDYERFYDKLPSSIDVDPKVKRDHRQVIRQLRDNLKSNENPLSLKETARQLGVSVGYLEYRFPAQCKDIVRRYMSYTRQEQLRKRYLAQSKALEYFMSKAKSDQPKSRKQAYRILKEQTGLPKFVLKRAINIAYRALHL